MTSEDQVPEAVRQLSQILSEARPMRRGSLGERWIKCGKERCACAREDGARHGPYFSLTWNQDSRTQSRRLTAEQADRVGEQIAAGRAFREQVEALWRACEAWADAELEPQTAREAEKGGSKRSSRRKSRPSSGS